MQAIKNLPKPTFERLNQSNQLKEHVIQKIKNQGGAITFASYMDTLLYEPNLGYYASNLNKLGKHGDFITAPELSSLFSQAVGNQCFEVLNQLKYRSTHMTLPSPCIIELGPGTGIMAADLLTYLEKKQALPASYAILELSPYLRQKQKETFTKKTPHLLPRIQWLNELPTSPIEGIIIANEVMDAMPVCRFKKDHVIKEYFVHQKNGNLQGFWDKPITPALQQASAKFQYLPNHYISEFHPYLSPWIASLSDCLETGVILLIDYGFCEKTYYHPDRNQGTLQCYYQHHSHSDPFLYPGLQDITAHINFSHVAKSASAHHLSILGYTHQAAFLINNDILGIAQTAYHINNPSDDVYQHIQAIKRLTLPHEMGELFKVLACGKNWPCHTALQGFSSFNRMDIL